MQRKAEDIIQNNQERERLKVAISEMERKFKGLNRQNFALEQQMNSYADILPTCRRLENHGVRCRELRAILKAVLDISASNGIPHVQAMEKFINDIRTQYDSKLGFEFKIEDLKCRPEAYQTVDQLYNLGLKNVDILQLGKVYRSISKKTCSMEDWATGLAKIVDVMSSMTKSDGVQNDKVAGILSNVRERLSQIRFPSDLHK